MILTEGFFCQSFVASIHCYLDFDKGYSVLCKDVRILLRVVFNGLLVMYNVREMLWVYLIANRFCLPVIVSVRSPIPSYWNKSKAVLLSRFWMFMLHYISDFGPIQFVNNTDISSAKSWNHRFVPRNCDTQLINNAISRKTQYDKYITIETMIKIWYIIIWSYVNYFSKL